VHGARELGYISALYDQVKGIGVFLEKAGAADGDAQRIFDAAQG